MVNIAVSKKLIAACKFAGIKVVRVRTPGKNKGRFGWCAVVDGTLERSPSTFASEEWAYAAAFSHYTKA